MEDLVNELHTNIRNKKEELLSVLNLQYGPNTNFIYKYYAPIIYRFLEKNTNSFTLIIHNFKENHHNLTDEISNNFVALNIDPLEFVDNSSDLVKLINKYKHSLFENSFDVFIKSLIKNVKTIYISDNKICRLFAEKYLVETPIITNYFKNPFQHL